MFESGREVLRAAAAVGATVVRVDDTEATRFRSLIEQRFLDSRRRGPLWESSKLPVSLQDAEAWRWLPEFVSGPAYLFFDPEDETAVFLFHSAEDLRNVLAESFQFEFYLADPMAKYVLCFNHHDFVAGGGAAAAWLSARGGTTS